MFHVQVYSSPTFFRQFAFLCRNSHTGSFTDTQTIMSDVQESIALGELEMPYKCPRVWDIFIISSQASDIQYTEEVLGTRLCSVEVQSSNVYNCICLQDTSGDIRTVAERCQGEKHAQVIAKQREALREMRQRVKKLEKFKPPCK